MIFQRVFAGFLSSPLTVQSSFWTSENHVFSVRKTSIRFPLSKRAQKDLYIRLWTRVAKIKRNVFGKTTLTKLNSRPGLFGQTWPDWPAIPFCVYTLGLLCAGNSCLIRLCTQGIPAGNTESVWTKEIQFWPFLVVSYGHRRYAVITSGCLHTEPWVHIDLQAQSDGTKKIVSDLSITIQRWTHYSGYIATKLGRHSWNYFDKTNTVMKWFDKTNTTQAGFSLQAAFGVVIQLGERVKFFTQMTRTFDFVRWLWVSRRLLPQARWI